MKTYASFFGNNIFSIAAKGRGEHGRRELALIIAILNEVAHSGLAPGLRKTHDFKVEICVIVSVQERAETKTTFRDDSVNVFFFFVEKSFHEIQQTQMIQESFLQMKPLL